MKKLLLISALAAAAFAPAKAASPYYVYEGGHASPAAQLEDGKTYVIYDANIVNNRESFRYVTDNGDVYGDHNDAKVPRAFFRSAYIWVAEANGDNWSFKNISNNKYLPVANFDGTVSVSDEPGEFKLIPDAAHENHFIVSNLEGTQKWDGNPGGNDHYAMVYWNGSGHPYAFYPVTTADDADLGIESGKTYKFKAISPTGVTKGREGQCINLIDLQDNRVTLAVEGTDIYVSAQEGQKNMWSFQANDENGVYLSGSLWNSAVSTEPKYWSMVLAGEEFDTNNPVVMLYHNTFASEGFLGFEGTLPGGYVDYGDAKALESDKYSFWEVIDADAAVKCTLTIKRSEDDENPIVIEEMYTAGDDFPSYEAFTCSNSEKISKTNNSVVYVLNSGKKMRIYNERAKKYVYISDINKIEQKKEIDETSTVFYQIPMGTDGGFAIYCPALDKFFGFVDENNAKLPADDFSASPVKWFTGKYEGNHVGDEYYPVYADWIGIENEGNNKSYMNDLGQSAVCRWTKIDAGSKWIIVTNQENFEENWAMRDNLVAAKAAYTAALEKVGLEPNQTLVNFVENFFFEGDVNIKLTSTTQANYEALLKAVDDAAASWPSKLMESTELYTIKASNNKGDNHGFLVYDAENGCITTVETAVDTNNDHLWGFVHVGDKFYLYNRGAEKFANAYKPYEGQSTIGAAYSWTIGDIPTAIVLSSDAFGNSEALNSNLFVIRGGKAGSINPAGIMIMANNTDHVPCCLGHNDITDGTGLILTAIRATDMDEAMKAKVAEALASVNDEIETICMPLEDEEFDADTHGKQVGHFTQEAVSALDASKAAAQALEDKEEAMYAALEAIRDFKKNESNYRQVEDGNVYTIADSEGNTHYTDGADHLTTDDASELKDVKYGYWVATVNEGKVSFSHTHESPEETPAAARQMYYANTQVVNFAAGNATEFTVNRSAVLGRVTLNDDASKSYVITHVSANANEATTEIAEINAGDKVGEIFDLQGRRLAAPVHGVNIINGKKVLVK